jgi:hypothetical protein
VKLWVGEILDYTLSWPMSEVLGERVQSNLYEVKFL